MDPGVALRLFTLFLLGSSFTDTSLCLRISKSAGSLRESGGERDLFTCRVKGCPAVGDVPHHDRRSRLCMIDAGRLLFRCL